MIDGPSVAAALAACGVTHVVWVPDSALGLWEEALRSDPGLARQYERVKLALAAKYAADRTRYVTEKAKWVSETLTVLHESLGR